MLSKVGCKNDSVDLSSLQVIIGKRQRKKTKDWALY